MRRYCLIVKEKKGRQLFIEIMSPLLIDYRFPFKALTPFCRPNLKLSHVGDSSQAELSHA